MPRIGSRFAATMLAALLLAGATGSAAAYNMPHADVPHSHDNPIVSRFSGSLIVAFHEVDYDEVALPLGPLRDTGFEKTLPATGKVTQIAYISPPGKSPAEVFANFRASLTNNGFKLLYSCAPDGCGGYKFATTYTKPLMQHDSPHGNDVIELLHSVNSDVRYLLAESQRGGRKVDVGLMVSQDRDDPVGVLLQVVENTEMTQDQVTVDAAAMSSALQSEGKIALYGLQFATDSATLQPDSDTTLKQMSDLLHQQPQMKVYIVGHTDNSGAPEHNLTLSQHRADAVVQALQTRFGIAANRLAARGMSSYSPVASNHTDAGKAKNRRVELVEQ